MVLEVGRRAAARVCFAESVRACVCVCVDQAMMGAYRPRTIESAVLDEQEEFTVKSRLVKSGRPYCKQTYIFIRVQQRASANAT